MGRFMAALSVAAFLTTSVAIAVAAQANGPAVIADIDAYWAGQFAAAGQPYSSPEVVAVEQSIETGCGTFVPAIVAGYCPLDGTIYYSAPAARDLSATNGDFAWVTILAHEWGHHAQSRFLLGGPPTRESELQADCLAGAYANDAAARDLIDTGQLTEAVAIAAQSGDASWLPEDAPGAHGSGPERASAFSRGYVSGIGGCDLGTG